MSDKADGTRKLSNGGLIARLGVSMACLLVPLGASAPVAQGEKFVHGVLAGTEVPAGGQFESEFAGPRDIAVNRSAVADGATDPLGNPVDGYVYVVDEHNHRIQVFEPDGSFVFMWGRGTLTGGTAAEVCDRTQTPCTVVSPDRSGTEGGMFDRPQGIVIDQDTGHVFVRERGTSNPPSDLRGARVQEFEADGTFVRAWGWDVVAGNATTTLETCLVATECKASAPGSGLGQFGASTSGAPGIALHQPSGDVLVADPPNRRIQRFAVPTNLGDPVPGPAVIGSAATFTSSEPEPRDVAVDNAGIVYASDGTQVDRYDSSGPGFIGSLSMEAFTGPLSAAALQAMDFDQVTDNLLTAPIGRDPQNVLVTPVLELSDPGAANASGVSLEETHVAGTDLVWNGIGVDPDAARLYLSSASGGHRVFFAQEGPAPPALVTFDPHTNVEARSATVNVQVNSNGSLPTSYDVQLSPSGGPPSFETVASGTAPAGTTPALESVELAGLRPNTAYLVRVVTRKPFGNPDVTVNAPSPLVTHVAPPDLAAVGGDSVEPTSARMTGRINPNGTGATYHFEWGESGLDNAVPVPDGSVGAGHGFVFVSERLAGLQPGTTYQFRLVAVSADSQFDPVASDVETFTTPLAPSTARAFELLSPPDKLSGVGVAEWYGGPGSVVSLGQAARVGDRFAVAGRLGAVLLDSAHGYANDWAFADRIGDRDGWVSHSPITHPACGVEGPRTLTPQAVAPDLSLITWASNGGLLHILAGTCDWEDSQVSNPTWISDWWGRWEIFGPTDPIQVDRSAATITAVAADSSAVVGASPIRGMAGPGDPTARHWPDLVDGDTVYIDDVSGGLSDSFPGAGVRELVHVCAGGTEVPAVSGAGDLVAAGCAAPAVGRAARLVSDRGAKLPGRAQTPEGTISRDGSRVFFVAPDPGASGVPDGRASFCATAGQTCPSQVFVWQRNPDGTRVTRWISRAEDGLFGLQDASLLGTARFEGATPDGDKVFFRTNSPLTVDDPNGLGAPVAGGVKTGEASDLSWDLYMYDLPDGAEADPGDGELTRITAGPDGGDCNRPQSESVDSGILRFSSDDGSRVYFVCAAPLDGVDAPLNSERLTGPGGEPSTTDQANLYLYDANRADPSDRWRFVARLPADVAGTGLDGCATSGTTRTTPMTGLSFGTGVYLANADINCVRGSSDGQFVSFWSAGRLVADDPPGGVSADIYAYDAEADELSRVTAPQGGAGGTYTCVTAGVGVGLQCFGDMGFDLGGSGVASEPLVSGSRQVFFQSRSQLVPEDHDGAYDVYEWRDGALSLVSTGASDTDGAFFAGNDVTGRNAYLATRDVLSWQDVDSVLDIYSARVGGGIVQPAAPPVCDLVADRCQGVGGGFTVPGIGSAVPDRGGAVPVVRGRLTVARPGRMARRRAVRRGVVRLRVRAVGDVGVVHAVARARVRLRSGRRVVRRIGADAARVGDSGRAVLAVRLSGRARRQLLRGGLAVSVRVSAKGAGSKSVRFMLRGAGR